MKRVNESRMQRRLGRVRKIRNTYPFHRKKTQIVHLIHYIFGEFLILGLFECLPFNQKASLVFQIIHAMLHIAPLLTAGYWLSHFIKTKKGLSTTIWSTPMRAKRK